MDNKEFSKQLKNRAKKFSILNESNELLAIFTLIRNKLKLNIQNANYDLVIQNF